MKKAAALFSLLTFISSLSLGHAAVEEIKINATVLVASNEGSDINIVNDAYRDEIIKLFSYSSYEEKDHFTLMLPRSGREHKALPDDYELILTLQGIEKDRVQIQAVIRKDNQQYVDTIVSILRPGVVFVGGPKTGEGGDLIIILETGF